MPAGLEERGQVVEQAVAVDVIDGLDEALLAQARDHALGVPDQRAHQQLADLGGHAVGQALDRAEVEDAEPAVVRDPVVSRVRVGVQQPGAGGSGEQELHVAAGAEVALLLRAGRRSGGTAARRRATR